MVFLCNSFNFAKVSSHGGVPTCTIPINMEYIVVDELLGSSKWA